MKYFNILLLLLVIVSCDSSKKKSTEEVEKKVTKTKSGKETTNNLLDPTKDLIVVLKNPEHITETKELISDSGLKWDKTLLDQDALKIGLIKIPADKKDYWLDKLIQSGEFKHVKLYSEKTLKDLIEKEKKKTF